MKLVLWLNMTALYLVRRQYIPHICHLHLQSSVFGVLALRLWIYHCRGVLRK